MEDDQEPQVQEPQVKTIEEYHERAPRHWPALIAYILTAIVIAVLIVLGARGIYHHYHKTTNKAATTSSKTTRPGTSSSASSTSSSGKSSSSTAGSSNTAGAAQAATGATASSSGNLPNSGPGQVVGLFVGTSLAVAAIHFVVSSQRSRAGLRRSK